MTHAERAARLNEVEILAEVIVQKMNLYVYETADNEEDEAADLAHNKELVKRLIAKTRTLGKDFSAKVQYTVEFAATIR